MIKRAFAFFVLLAISAGVLKAQDTTGLKAGDKAPGLIFSATDNAMQSLVFPYHNKMVFLFFWSSSSSHSKANLYKYSKINSIYANMDYRSCDGFEMMSVALQSDKNSWVDDLKTYGLIRLTNGISLRGFNDLSAKAFKVSETPASFLIDETGKIVFVNPDIKTLVDYLNQRKNSISSPEAQTKLSGKLLFGAKDIAPLGSQKIYLLNEKNDTLYRVVTEENGNFQLDNINTAIDYQLRIVSARQVGDDDKVYLAMPGGEILAMIPRKDRGFEYKLLSSDMPFLKPVKSSGIKTKVLRELKDLHFTENIFKKTGTELTKEATLVVDKVVATLKKDPKTHLEIITHTDSKGAADANLSLSVKRSIAISNYMVSKGIDKSRLKALGKGGTEPLNKCAEGIECSEEELEVNRRTEFRFYKTE